MRFELAGPPRARSGEENNKQLKNVEDIYAVSPMQEAMLLHALNNAEADTLLNQFQFEMEGPLDVPSFEESWQMIVDSHAALRTAFIWQDVRQPLQVVRGMAKVSLCQKDFRHMSDADSKSAYRKFLEEDRQRGFDLHRAPLMRFCIIRFSDQRWRFVWTSHHLILDRWCLKPIYRELYLNYARLSGTDADGVTAGRAGFKSYINWISRQDKSAALAYWSTVLQGRRKTQSVLSAAPRGGDEAVAHPHGSALHLESPFATALEDFARKNALTLNVVVQAAWSLALNRLLGTQDAVFGVTVSGRPTDLPDVESIIGSFINNVPVRAKMPGEERVFDWLRGLQGAQFERAPYEYVTAGEIEKHLQAKRIDSSFDSLFVWLTGTGEPDEFPMRALSTSYATAYPLTVSGMRTAHGIMLRADARQECIVPLSEVLAALSDCLHVLLELQPEAELRDIPGFQLEPDFDFSAEINRPDIMQRGDWSADTGLAALAAGRERLGIDVLQELIRAEWRHALGDEPSRSDVDFFEAGGTSIRAAGLHARLEAATRQSIPMLALFQSPTVQGIARTIFEKDWPVRTGIATCIRAEDDCPPLFCIASPEVNTVGYSLLARHLDDHHGVYVLQSPPEDNQLRQIHPTALPEMAGRYAAALRKVQPTGPYRLLGMCTGSHIALEMCRQFERDGDDVEFLGVIDTWALYTISPLYHVHRLMNILRYYMGRVRDIVWLGDMEHAGASTVGFTQAEISGQARVDSAESLEGQGSAWVNDVGFARNDPKVDKVDARAYVFRLKPQQFWRIRDRGLGWSRQVKDVSVIDLAGTDHKSILREPYIEHLATALAGCLEPLDARHCVPWENGK